jgi:hypothetical protein
VGWAEPGLALNRFFFVFSNAQWRWAYSAYRHYSGITVTTREATGQMPVAIVGLGRLLHCSVVVVLDRGQTAAGTVVDTKSLL